MKVQELMTRDVRSCQPTDALSVAARLMWENDCGSVPVIDDQARVIGMITDRDIAMAAYLQARPIHQAFVSDAMSKRLHTCRAEDPVSAAERTMQAEQIRRLPVVDDHGRLAGILSLSDLARWAAPRRGKLSSEELAATLAAICEPRLPLAPLTVPVSAAPEPEASSAPATKPKRTRRRS